MIEVTYNKNLKMWTAGYKDEIGKLGQGFTAKSRDDAIFALGMSMGRNPQVYARPIGEYFNHKFD